MGSAAAVFVGDVALDEFFRPATWPPETPKLDLEQLGAHVGGMIANAAAVYAGLGEPTRFAWTMNAGPVTERLLADLAAAGIDTTLVVRDDAVADSRNLILLTADDHVVMTPALGLTEIRLTDVALAALCGARFVYTAIGDLRLLRHGADDAVGVLDRIRAAGTPVVLDLDVAAVRDGDEALLARIDVLLVNAVGFDRLRAGRGVEETVAALLGENTRILVRTLGAQGCVVHTHAGAVVVPAVPVEPVDVTGAGDTFGAAFAYALARTTDPAVAATFAAAAAAQAVTAVGARAGVGSRDGVDALLRAHGRTADLADQPSPFALPVPPSERQSR